MADLSRLQRRPETRAFSVDELLRYVQEGRLRIPVFARAFLWSASNVLEFFDSLYRGIPVGHLLLAKQPGKDESLHFGPLRVQAPQSADALFVIDGQQRLTALAATLLHPDPRPRGDSFAIWFDPESQTFRRLDAMDAPLHWIPMNAVADPMRLLGWLQTWPLHTERKDLAERAIALGTALKSYQLPAYVVEGTSVDMLRLIFKRTNSSGVALREADMLETLLSEREPRPIAAACRRLEETGFGPLPEELFIRCLKAVEGWASHLDIARAQMDPDAVERTELALRRAITFLTLVAGIPHIQFLPYSLPLVILAKFFHLVPEPSLRTSLLLSRWLWRGALSHVHADGARPSSRLLSGITSDPHTSVKHLLESVPRAPAHPSASAKWNLQSAQTKLCAVALFHMGARDPDTEAVVDLHSLQDRLSWRDKQIFLDVAPPGPSTVARHVLLAGPEKLPILPAASPEVLRSHGMDEEAARALRVQNLEIFEQRRVRILDAWFARFFRERSAPDESDRPPITELLRRVDERASTP
ncbi:MAG TPA: DUF262 domain-containing protein [Myxococcus sp.]|nr:DUF262 domain-containing protein [Myxococcus sp.]